MTTPASTTPASRWRRYAPLAAIVLALALFFGFGLNKTLSLDYLVERREALLEFVAARPASAIAGFIGIYALAVAISAPGATMLTIAAGVLFGLWPGALVAGLGATLGACMLFLAAHSSLGEALAKRAGPAVVRMRAGFRDNATGYMLFLRLSPLFPFWFVNLAAALAGVPFRTFLWTTALGIAPATVVFAATGASLDRIAMASLAARRVCLSAGRTDCGVEIPLSAIISPQIFALLIGLSLIALAPIVARRARAARNREPAA